MSYITFQKQQMENLGIPLLDGPTTFIAQIKLRKKHLKKCLQLMDKAKNEAQVSFEGYRAGCTVRIITQILKLKKKHA